MRKLLCLVVLAALFSCNQPYYDDYRVIRDPNNGTQMVVVRDNNGTEFLMDYMLFNQLYYQGGYNTVIHHYHDNRATYPRYNSSSYRGWRDETSGFRSTYNKSRPSGFKNTTPSGFKNTTSTSSSTSGFRNTTPTKTSSGFRSSSSPSRSSGFKPSRSSSSGFRRK